VNFFFNFVFISDEYVCIIHIVRYSQNTKKKFKWWLTANIQAQKKIKGKVKFFIFFSFIRLFKKQNEIQVHVHGCQLLKAIFISHTSNSERKKNTRVLPLFNIYFNNTMNFIDFFVMKFLSKKLLVIFQFYDDKNGVAFCLLTLSNWLYHYLVTWLFRNRDFLEILIVKLLCVTCFY